MTMLNFLEQFYPYYYSTWFKILVHATTCKTYNFHTQKTV